MNPRKALGKGRFFLKLIRSERVQENSVILAVKGMEGCLRPQLEDQIEDQKDMAMVWKNKTLSALAVALLASATAFQPVAAQTNDSWYAQGGYDDNAPYANYPNDGGAYGAPYDQTTVPTSGTYYGGTDAESYAREQAAQEWRSQYQAGAPAPANQSYNTQPTQNTYPQTNQGYAGQDYYAQTNQGYPNQGYPNQGYANQGYANQNYAGQNYAGQGYYADQNYYAGEDYYSASDHYAYRRECERQRANNQVGGLVFGAIAGGLIGNAVSNRGSRGGGTAVGAILGGALGAGIASNLDCDDRYYVHQTYYDGFERGYSNRTYQWRNPNSGHHGAFRVGDYYRGQAGQRCATYAQTIWIQGRPERARGYACRRGDGSWEIVS